MSPGILPTAVAEASKGSVDPRTLCGLATKEMYDAQDSLIIAVSCRYLLAGIDACVKTGLYTREGISGLLLVGIAKYYKVIEKYCSVQQRPLLY